FDFHWQTTDRLMGRAERLTEVQVHEHPGYGHGSIHDLLFHILRTDISWRRALQTGKQLAPIQEEDFKTLGDLQDGFRGEQGEWQALLEGLSAEQIEGTIELTSWRGDVFNMTRWRILQHLVLHGMQHHTEVAQLLTSHGQSPGDIDFIFF
ncbi:MAG: DinB family protein, partial [Anaerolineales bacterium]